MKEEGPGLGDLFVSLDVFRLAGELVVQHRSLAQNVAHDMPHEGLRTLLHDLLEVVLPTDRVSYAAAS